MSGAYPAEEDADVYRPIPAPKKAKPAPAPSGGGTMLDALFANKQAKEQFRAMVLEVLRSPEGQELLAKAVRRELLKQK